MSSLPSCFFNLSPPSRVTLSRCLTCSPYPHLSFSSHSLLPSSWCTSNLSSLVKVKRPTVSTCMSWCRTHDTCRGEDIGELRKSMRVTLTVAALTRDPCLPYPHVCSCKGLVSSWSLRCISVKVCTAVLWCAGVYEVICRLHSDRNVLEKRKVLEDALTCGAG